MTIAIPAIIQVGMAMYSAYNTIEAIKSENWGAAAMSAVGAYVGLSGAGASIAASTTANTAKVAGASQVATTGIESVGSGLDMSPTIANANTAGLGDLGTLSSTAPAATSGITEIATNAVAPTSGGLLGGLGDITTSIGDGIVGAWDGLVGGMESLTDIGGGLVKDLAGNTFDAATGIKTGGSSGIMGLAKPLLSAGLNERGMNKKMDYNDKVREEAAAEKEATRSRRASINTNNVSDLFAKYK